MKFMILPSRGGNGVQKSIEFLRNYNTFRTRGGKGAEFIYLHCFMESHVLLHFMKIMNLHGFATFHDVSIHFAIPGPFHPFEVRRGGGGH